MDPNATLKAIFDAKSRDKAMLLCEALEHWLKRGGFTPRVPSGSKHWPGTNTNYAILSPAYDTGGRWAFVKYSSSGNRIAIYLLEG